MDERRAKLNYKFETGVKSNHRHVRTRLYFTSESHIHGLLNVLRFSHLNGSTNIVSTPARPRLQFGCVRGLGLEGDILGLVCLCLFVGREREFLVVCDCTRISSLISWSRVGCFHSKPA